MPKSPPLQEAIARVDALTLAREVESLATCIQAEVLQDRCSRAFLETYSARLLKTTARLYALTLLPPVPPTVPRPLSSLDEALLHTFTGVDHAT